MHNTAMKGLETADFHANNPLCCMVPFRINQIFPRELFGLITYFIAHRNNGDNEQDASLYSSVFLTLESQLTGVVELRQIIRDSRLFIIKINKNVVDWRSGCRCSTKKIKLTKSHGVDPLWSVLLARMLNRRNSKKHELMTHKATVGPLKVT
jgi:hypothetical protein